jgi:hypothetical protein
MEVRLRIQTTGEKVPSKITYDGFVERDGIPHVCFKNENEDRVEIALDPATARHIQLYMNILAPGELKPVERGNDDDS